MYPIVEIGAAMDAGADARLAGLRRHRKVAAALVED
jgi:hypothetical protein